MRRILIDDRVRGIAMSFKSISPLQRKVLTH